jgi:hypothetical protein
MVSTTEDSPARQLLAAWQAATAVAAEWAERTAAVTAEAFHKLTSDPAVRAVGEVWRVMTGWPQRDCECSCTDYHPDDLGVCDHRAVITRRLPAGRYGGADVPLCAPCAVAQGVAEMPG